MNFCSARTTDTPLQFREPIAAQLTKRPRRRPTLTAALALGTLFNAACAGSENETVEEALISELDTVVSLESELLATPLDLAVHEGGSLFVVDSQMSHIAVIPADGGPPVP